MSKFEKPLVESIRRAERRNALGELRLGRTRDGRWQAAACEPGNLTSAFVQVGDDPFQIMWRVVETVLTGRTPLALPEPKDDLDDLI